MANEEERNVTLKRDVNDNCRELNHRACGHIGGGGSRRTRYVGVCTCPCHADCPSVHATIDTMDHLCTCDQTRDKRQREANRLGVKAKKRHVIRGGSADDGWEASVSFLITMAVMPVLFVAAIITAHQENGVVAVVAIVVAVITGLYVAWIGLITIAVRIIVKIVKTMTSKT